MAIRVCLAGATGWAGSALARGIAQTDDLSLVAAVSRTQAGKRLGEVLGEPRLGCSIYATVQEAMEGKPCEVFFDYTKPEAAKANCLTALECRGARGDRHVGINRRRLCRTGTGCRTAPESCAGGGELRPDGRAAAEIRRDGSQVYPAMGDHRLRT